MGKSPGKWIKTVLFGKKATRSNSTKGRSAAKTRNDKGLAKEPPTSIQNSLVISTPILVRAHNNDINPDLEQEISPNFNVESSIKSIGNVDSEKHANSGPININNQEQLREVKAATKAQAAFRGFLARRAFRALKGIIRLQAVVRGHLVRRQAVVTLHSLLGIIKFQSLVRGQRVRSSDIGLEVKAKLIEGKAIHVDVPKLLNSRKNKLYSNAFACKLYSSSLVIMPLQIKYNPEDPSSVYSWMQRWTIAQFWKLPVQPKKIPDTKSQPKRNSYAMETESGKQKRNGRRNSNVDTCELEKPKRVQKKTITSGSNSVLEHPQSELEKVKRNLRKVSGSNAEICDSSIHRDMVENDKKSNCFNDSSEMKGKKKILSLIPDPDSDKKDIKEKKKDLSLTPDFESDKKDMKENKDSPYPESDNKDTELVSESKYEPESIIIVEESVDSTALDHPSNTPQVEKTNTGINGELNFKEVQTCDENQKTGKRRASFSTKSEYTDNCVQNEPSVPSYMQATKSAKAKLRQSSPRSGSDSTEKKSATRRHSLPSSINGKVTSNSPRTHKILQASGKGSLRNDGSLSFSRDSNEKPVQVEWRR